ncbi:MAG: tetratricopeptide repeat protein [Acidobacteriota bacterium]
MKTLTMALDYAQARPYALAIMGAEHLRVTHGDTALLDHAIAELSEGSSLLPSDASVHSNLGMAFMLRGDQDRAMREAQTALQLDPARAKTRYVLGEFLRRQGHIPEALFHLRIAATEMESARKLILLLEYTQLHAVPE